MPWKKGGGVTREMFIVPEGATLENEDFLWRLSSADISESGPFSVFPGYDRVLFLLSGNGMEISANGKKLALVSPFDSVRFRGEHETYCALRDGPATDLNIICRRDALSCEYRQFLPSKETGRVFLSGHSTILVCLKGAVDAKVEGNHRLNEMDVLLIHEHPWGTPLFLQYGENSRLLVITLTKR